LVVVPKASSAQEGTWLGLATYAWSGYVLECARCGVIYRSREHWYGNDSPETKSVVQTEIAHIWPGMRSLQGSFRDRMLNGSCYSMKCCLSGTQNAARRLLDGVSALTGTVSTLSSGPTKSVGHWVADKIAPDYWTPNASITNCDACRSAFGGAKIHHCRACGKGFCEKCSDYRRPVVERGWGYDPVRVCKACYDDYNKVSPSLKTEVL
jgi:zinc finger FYVE domain-containing protein 1